MVRSRIQSVLVGIFVFMLVIPGCGGGSRGTGTLTIEGQVRTLKGVPLSGAEVTNLETGSTATTVDTGAFSLVTERLRGNLSFLVETPGLQVTSRGGELISDDAEVVVVTIVIDNERPTPTANQDVRIKKKQSKSSSSSSSKSSSKSSSSSTSKNSAGSSSSASSISSSSSSSQGSSASSSSSSSGTSSSNSSDDDDEEIRVRGVIESLTSNSITVRSTTFTVDGRTDFDGHQNLSQFSIGEKVEVRGSFTNGVLIAQRIKLDD